MKSKRAVGMTFERSAHVDAAAKRLTTFARHFLTPRDGGRSVLSGRPSMLATRQFWICPQCQRHVPERVSACQCGYLREGTTNTKFTAPTTGAHVAEGTTSGFYVKDKVWEQPCPRCSQPSSVNLYRIAPVWKAGVIVAVLVLFVISLSDTPYGSVTARVLPLMTVLIIYLGQRAKCHSCGASLKRTLRGGWA